MYLVFHTTDLALVLQTTLEDHEIQYADDLFKRQKEAHSKPRAVVVS